MIKYLHQKNLNPDFSPSRVNPSSHSADSFTYRLHPQANPLLLLLQTCASKPHFQTPPSPPPKQAILRVEGTLTPGGIPGWAPPPSPRAARLATLCPDRSSPAGTCLLYNGQRGRSSPPNSWASNQDRTDQHLPEHHVPGCQTWTTWRRLPSKTHSEPHDLWTTVSWTHSLMQTSCTD